MCSSPRPVASLRAQRWTVNRRSNQPLAGVGDVAAEALNAPGLLEQVAAVARRSAIRTLRQRALLVFPLLFPLILFAINGSALSAATRIPGFPPVSYRAFVLAVPFMQGALSSRSAPAPLWRAISSRGSSTGSR